MSIDINDLIEINDFNMNIDDVIEFIEEHATEDDLKTIKKYY